MWDLISRNSDNIPFFSPLVGGPFSLEKRKKKKRPTLEKSVPKILTILSLSEKFLRISSNQLRVSTNQENKAESASRVRIRRHREMSRCPNFQHGLTSHLARHQEEKESSSGTGIPSASTAFRQPAASRSALPAPTALAKKARSRVWSAATRRFTFASKLRTSRLSSSSRHAVRSSSAPGMSPSSRRACARRKNAFGGGGEKAKSVSQSK